MIFVDACFGKETEYTPVWMMRQAGRYLPEYMEVRRKIGNFLDMTRNPEVVAEVTIQPIDILDVDAAILFSDILNLPMEMGLPLRFEKGVGPVFDKTIDTEEDIEALDSSADEKLEYVYKGVKLIRERLPEEKALIGFAGSPWTIATYMVEGRGSKQYAKIKKMVYSNPMMLHRLLAFNTKETIEYLSKQIDAGANAVMVFDSWGGALEKEKFFEFSWNYMKEIAKNIKAKYPHIPVILFSKGVGLYMDEMDGEFDVVGVDWATPIDHALRIFKDNYTLQGNMEPTRLYSKTATKEAVEKIAGIMKGHRHIFNLGHGILPDVPVENAKYFVNLCKELTRRG
ncbi:uroporphyrinogen decarboxylase [Nautilia profundicola AmH]|uniref:Uroporphyrinogen decarboxylase n=1 Tax=Nautilia profundicola (strain ATCC BAA-1463 / DSM 18972 / AmH) TaxID=598659 RepID=DCUP_NAUPA|nr:uroporphyrinogen decarboxylase [Nautilia profundicola]B9L8M1.1 RecName: Full=Uroporphyrinogen decarboxylase; Short=UPD; Short=URO-D [Nautilia profundicola AmH]ACM92401.1 uroporphyrinogen decarboxylase [Nautilia profundicola AmH]